MARPSVRRSADPAPMNWAQIIINGVITASELGIIAVGLTMTFSVLRFANFAHTETAVVGAYLTFTFNVGLHWNLLASMVVAAGFVGLIGIAIDRCIFRVMRDAGDVTPMIASLGLAIVIRHTIQAIFGPQILRYDYEVKPGLRVLGGFITAPQIGVFAIAAVAMLIFHVLLQYTRIGKAMRATSTNRDLAKACGIDTEKVTLVVWFIGSGFAGLGGALVAWDTQLDPYLGFVYVIPVFSVVLIGGVGSVYGAIAAALLVAMAQSFIVAFDLSSLIPGAPALRFPVAYKAAVIYGAVVLLLMLRPSGLARKEA
jgi:branched-subunit amino acid ABC-type transport system permease component